MELGNLFIERLNKAIDYVKNDFKIDMEIEDILKDIKLKQDDYENIISNKIWDDEIIELRIDQMDFILMIYENIYKELSNSLLSNNLKIWEKENRPFEINIIYIIRFIVQDILVLRNLVNMKFESQFNSILRNLMDKFNVFFLCMMDYQYSCNYFFNDSNLNKKDFYYKITRPTAIRKKLKENYDNIIKDEETSKIVYQRTDKFIYEFLLKDTIEYNYGFNSKFVHTNDMNTMMKYYNEDGKLNISLKSGCSKHFIYRADFCFEMLLSLYNYISSIFMYRSKKINQKNYDMLLIGYFSVLIDENYKEE